MDTPLGQRAGRYIRTLDRLFHNDSGNIRLNGEGWLLSRLSDRAEVVLDVGANRGSWTRHALDALPGATVHSFEPIHETFVLLERAVGAMERVHLNEMALSDHNGTLRMWADRHDGQMSSATAPPDSGGRETHISCATGDSYCAREGISHIDLLKIDVEGHEMEVLEGFEGSFRDGTVDLVQFEFTLWAAIARRWLADYYQFFTERGFQVGKLWPGGVRWKEYSPEDEQFYRCNFVAARKGSEIARLIALA